MTSGDVNRQPEGARQADRAPDPWGVKRAENLLTSLQGVLSARVVVSPVGEIIEVHVLTQSGIPPKQMVRNVESALLAHLGLKVDHRKISIAQTADVKPIATLEAAAVRGLARKREILFKGLEVGHAGSHRLRVLVTLSVDGEDVTGERELADTPKARMQGAAAATVAVLDTVFEPGMLELEGVKMVSAFDTELVCAGVHVVEGRSTHILIGTAELRGSMEQSAALAVLDATNRWLQQRS